MICLTFDDGPSVWTEPILDLLAEAGAHATFFVSGWAVEGNERIVARAVSEGHEIGNHTFSHRRLLGLTDAVIKSEILMTAAALFRAAEVKPRLWRAPYLLHDSRIECIAAGLGLEHVSADVDPADWKNKADAVVGAVLNARGDGEIVLLHDGMPKDGGSCLRDRTETVKAVRRILELIDTPFVTVTDMELAAVT